MFKLGNPGGGRPKKSSLWKTAEKELQQCLPYMLRLTKQELKTLMDGKPTGAQIVTYNFMMKYPESVIDRMYPSVWADEPIDNQDLVSQELRQELSDLGNSDNIATA